MKNKLSYYYDTSALLDADLNTLINDNSILVVSTITLEELEHIKTSKHKDDKIKYQARQVIKFLTQYKDKYITHIFKSEMLDNIKTIFEPEDINNDLKILAGAIDYDNNCDPDETIFVTNDLSLQNIANLFFGSDSIIPTTPVEDNYTGYKEIVPTAEDIDNIYVYDNPYQNVFDLQVNEYLILKDEDNKAFDIGCWNGKEYRRVKYEVFESETFGTVKPLDPYQQCYFDSLKHNELTLVGGPAGSGKTLGAFAYLFSLLEKEEIDRIIVFCNPVVARNAAKLGSKIG